MVMFPVSIALLSSFIQECYHMTLSFICWPPLVLLQSLMHEHACSHLITPCLQPTVSPVLTHKDAYVAGGHDELINIQCTYSWSSSFMCMSAWAARLMWVVTTGLFFNAHVIQCTHKTSFKTRLCFLLLMGDNLHSIYCCAWCLWIVTFGSSNYTASSNVKW